MTQKDLWESIDALVHHYSNPGPECVTITIPISQALMDETFAKMRAGLREAYGLPPEEEAL